jgi:hypothetical protein
MSDTQELSHNIQSEAPTLYKSEIHLLQNTLEFSCVKWFTLTTRGSLSIKDLVEKNCEAKDIFTQSEILGVSDHLPAIIANTSSLSPYCLYLEKFPHDISKEDIPLWLQTLCNNLKGYVEKKMGIYIPPQLNEILSEEKSFLSYFLETLNYRITP